MRFRRARREQKKTLANGGARRADLRPHFPLDVEADQRAAPFQRVGQNEADALAGARRAIHINMARTGIAHILAVKTAEENRIAGLAVRKGGLAQIPRGRQPRPAFRRYEPRKFWTIWATIAPTRSVQSTEPSVARATSFLTAGFSHSCSADWIGSSSPGLCRSGPKRPTMGIPARQQRKGGFPDQEQRQSGENRSEIKPARMSLPYRFVEPTKINLGDAARRPAAQLHDHGHDRANIIHDLGLGQFQLGLQGHQRQTLESAKKCYRREAWSASRDGRC